MANPNPILSRKAVLFAAAEQTNDLVASWNSGTQTITLTTGGLGASALIGREVIIYDGAADTASAYHRTTITANAAGTITLLESPSFTPAASDYVVFPDYALSSIDPDGAAGNAVLSTIPELTFNGEMLTRDYAKKSLTPIQGLMGNKSIGLSFSCELKGAGGGGGSLPNVNELDVLLKACGFGRLDYNTGGNRYRQYDPVSESFESCAIDVFADGLKWTLRGCVGNATFKFEQGKIPMIDFVFSAMYADPSDAAMTSPTYDSELPVPLTYANLQAAGQTDVPASTLEVSLNNEIIEYYNMSKQSEAMPERFLIASRAPSGSFNPQAVLTADEPWLSNFSAGTVLGTFSLRVGADTSTGNITSGQSIDFTFGAKAQQNTMGFSDDGGVRRFDIGFNVASALTAGNDDISIKFY
tara:strand:+ start:5140 stop:6378 length:1239 start_codon:yes stop_codon:yes gene_type:complete